MIKLEATERIDSGDEITISYGQQDNRSMVHQYGFVLPGNPGDRVDLSVSCPRSISPEAVLKLLQAHGHTPDGSTAARRCADPRCGLRSMRLQVSSAVEYHRHMCAHQLRCVVAATVVLA